MGKVTKRPVWVVTGYGANGHVMVRASRDSLEAAVALAMRFRADLLRVKVRPDIERWCLADIHRRLAERDPGLFREAHRDC